jgi:hypothetical protein
MKMFLHYCWIALYPNPKTHSICCARPEPTQNYTSYHVLEGAHDFNWVLWAPPGTRATIFNPPETRTSWGPRAIDAWYIGPAPQHYRCYNLYLPTTGGTRTSAQATFYPQHCKIPHETPMDTTRHIATDLVHAIQKLRKQDAAHPGRHTAAVHQLSTIFQESTGQIVRVDVPITQTSTTPTAMDAVRKAPRRHTRNTRGNTPDTAPKINAPSNTIHPEPHLTRQHSEGAPRTKRLCPDVPATIPPEKRRSPKLTPLAHGRHTRRNT